MKQLVQYDISTQISEEKAVALLFKKKKKKKKKNAYVTWMQKEGIMLIPMGNYKASIFLVPKQVETFT